MVSMDITTIGTSLVIVILTYVVGMAAKNIPWVKDEWIPVIVAVSGGVLGVLGMTVIPEFPAQDYMTAIAVGCVSGLASTGVNQAYKQLFTK